MTQQCSKCGSEVDPGQPYCLECGTALDKERPAPSVPPKHPKLAAPSATTTPHKRALSPKAGVTPFQLLRHKNRRSVIYGFFAAIIRLSIIASVAFSPLLHPTPTKYKNLKISSNAATFSEKDSKLTITTIIPTQESADILGRPCAAMNVTVKNQATGIANDTIVDLAPMPLLDSPPIGTIGIITTIMWYLGRRLLTNYISWLMIR